MSSTTNLRAFEDGYLYLFTSLTAGSSHIITATSRLETILKANRIPFQAIDIATDEQARRLWQRRAQKKKLPGLVKDGYIIGDLEEIEEWNEFGELKENIGDIRTTPAANTKSGINIRPPGDSASPSSRSLEPGLGSPRDDELGNSPRHPSASETASALVDESSRVALPGAAEIRERNKGKSSVAGVSPSAFAASPPPPKAVDEPVGPGEAGKDDERTVSSAGDAAAPTASSDLTTISPAAAPEPAPVADADSTAKTHRGSDVEPAPVEDVKKVESENTLHEDPAAEETLEQTTKGMESVHFDEPEKPQD